MKRLTILFILLGFVLTSGGQSIEELKSLLNSTRNPFITPDNLDGIMISLRKYKDHPLPDQDSLVQEIYKTVTSAYVANNHFKQGYQVFNIYLAYREDLLTKQKSAALSGAMNSVGERARNDENDQLRLKNQLSELRDDNGALTKKLVFYKSNFSLILIILSVIFAVILAGYGIRSFSLRSRLNQNRSTMKDIHHFALTGQYEEGVRNALQSSIRNLETEIADVKKQFALK